jgi:biotin-dependent carboxylase-like uncharacterized protein
MTQISVLRAGPLTTVQDAGRPGLAHLGVPPSGAADRRALERGNRLVGNREDAAALEATLVGPRLCFDAPALVALTGAETEASVPHGVSFAVGEGDELDVGRCLRGVRAYVCVRGGIDVAPTLRSRSTDVFTGLGPPPLRDGDVLRIGTAAAAEPADVEPEPELPDELVLRVRLGPRDDWFTSDAIDTLLTAGWRVSSASNRVGVRLEGPPLERREQAELLSEGVVTGAIQVPAGGGPIVLLPDHPTTGGYPVIAVVDSRDLWLAGQAAPGATVRFEV